MRVLQYLFHNIRMIESSLIALLLWWAFILALPIDTFGTSVAYSAMADIAPEGVWASLFLGVGIVNAYGMILEKKAVQMTGLLLASGLWIFVCAMFGIAELATTATGTYFIIACLNAYVYYKVGEEYGNR